MDFPWKATVLCGPVIANILVCLEPSASLVIARTSVCVYDSLSVCVGALNMDCYVHSQGLLALHLQHLPVFSTATVSESHQSDIGWPNIPVLNEDCFLYPILSLGN